MTTTKRPSPDHFETAIQWLEENEGDGFEKEACTLVAAWLREQENQRFLRACARDAGVPVAGVRKHLAKRQEGAL